MGLVLSFMVALKLSATQVIVEVKPANLPVSKHTGKADFSFFFLMNSLIMERVGY